MVLFAIVIVSGIYGLALQHLVPRLMKERLPAETVYEQIPHIRAQLYAAAEKMRDSFRPTPPAKSDAGAPAPSAAKTVTTGSNPMVSTTRELSTPAARAKTVVGSTITAGTVSTPAVTAVAEHPPAPSPTTPAPGSKPRETMGTPSARVPEGASVPAGNEPAPAASSSSQLPSPTAAPAPADDAASEIALLEFLEQQILPYLAARRGDKFRLGNSRYAEDLFRFIKLRVSEVYRGRVEEMQAWCDERRMLDLQLKLQHWLHGWLFVHAPISFLLVMLTAWHAYVTLFRY
jgi:hypothetical protein